MAVVPVDSWFLGAGDVYLDSVRIGSTRENNVVTLLMELDAPIVNGRGGKFARTDYYIREPYPQLQMTFIELSETSMGLIIPGATAADSGDDVVISPPAYRRLLGTDYHEWELRVPGVDGQDVHFTIPLGINVANPEFAAADSATPLGPRLTIEGRFDPDDDTQPCWSMLLVDAAAS